MVETTVEQQTGAETVVWDLSPLYKSVDDPAIDRDMKALRERTDQFAKTYRGRVGDLDAEEMVDALKEAESIFDTMGRMGSFANLKYTEDTGNPRYGALLQKVTEFYSELGQKVVFFELEWNSLDDAKVAQILANPTLTDYRHYLEAERRFKPYKLSEIEEQLLMDKAVTGNNAWVRFIDQLVNALRFEVEGKELTLEETTSRLFSPNREVRKEAAAALTKSLKTRLMEATFVHNTLAADKASDDRRRRYPSWISARNLNNKVPDETVDALVEAVTSNFELVARHYRLKRVLLGLDELYNYDMYAPLPISDEDRMYSWDEARDIVVTAFSRFHPRVGEIAQEFFDKNWIHAAVNPGKGGGAFCDPCVPSHHPYVMVNFTGRVRDVATLAHELGHALHFYLTHEKQTLLNANMPLTIAEMASVFGEMLVFHDLMDKEPDPKVRLAMLSQKIEDAFATVFRQIAFNRFENAVHTTRREQGELTTEQLNAFWQENLQAMFGDGLTITDDYSVWWSYVGHFLFAPGYVYAYAFGELLVLALYNLYREQGDAFVPNYIDVLAAGGSDWPEKIVGQAGVDLTDPDFWQQGIRAIEELIEQEEALAREVYPEKFA